MSTCAGNTGQVTTRRQRRPTPSHVAMQRAGAADLIRVCRQFDDNGRRLIRERRSTTRDFTAKRRDFWPHGMLAHGVHFTRGRAAGGWPGRPRHCDP